MKGFDLIVRGFHRAIRRLRDGADRRRAILELGRMQDWRLADMGIERGRIPEIVDGLIALRNAGRPDARAPAPPNTAAGAIAGGPPVSGAPA